MKAPKEYKNWVSFLRKKFGKKNGVVDICLFDSPEMERKLNNDKRSQRHKKWVDEDT
jgi:hypothetical protein